MAPNLTFQKIASVGAKLQPGCAVDAQKEPTVLHQDNALKH